MKKIRMIILWSILMVGLTGCGYSDILGGKNTVKDNDTTINENVEVKDNTSNIKAIDVNIGKNIEYLDNYIISFVSSNFTQDVVPSNPDSYYSHYEVKDKNSNTYFILKTTIKNLGAEKLDGEKLPSAKLIYDGKYKYDAFRITELDDGSDLEGYDWYMNIDPLKTMKIWYLVEVPKEVESSTDKKLIMEYQINDKTYHIAIR